MNSPAANATKNSCASSAKVRSRSRNGFRSSIRKRNSASTVMRAGNTSPGPTPSRSGASTGAKASRAAIRSSKPSAASSRTCRRPRFSTTRPPSGSCVKAIPWWASSPNTKERTWRSARSAASSSRRGAFSAIPNSSASTSRGRNSPSSAAPATRATGFSWRSPWALSFGT